MGTRRTQVSGLAAAGSSVTRYGLVTTVVWIGVLKFTDYEVQNAEPLVTASLTSRLRKKLGAQKLAWLVGVTQITLGSLIAAKPLVPRASAVGSFGAAGIARPLRASFSAWSWSQRGRTSCRRKAPEARENWVRHGQSQPGCSASPGGR